MTLLTHRRSATLSFALLVALLVGACRGSGDEIGHAASTSTTAPSDQAESAVVLLQDFDPVDTRTVELEPVGGREPSPEPVEVYGGDAKLEGTLAYLGRPVEGAVVRLERVVDGRTGVVEVMTGTGGYWVASDIHGGRYVIRAWKEPELALAAAETLFLAEDEEIERHFALVTVVVAPPADVDVDESEEEADDEKDDADEEAEDESEGEEPPDVADVGVGSGFSVPAGGPLPAGTYQSSDDQFCETVYERWIDGAWESKPQVSRGWTLNTSTVIRNLREAPGSEPCSYERTG